MAEGTKEKKIRNSRIVAKFKRGASMMEIADYYGLSRQRVYQIITREVAKGIDRIK